MNISILGLGYVGCVVAACLADDGHNVIAMDINPDKVDLLNSGRTPIIEKGIGEIIEKNVKENRLRATNSIVDAITNTDISFVCVGTPSEPNGSLKLTFVKRVSEEIGAVIATKKSRHLIVIRSTVLPGTVRDVVIPAIEKSSGKNVGSGFGVCFNPEFLREGSSVFDHYNPAKVVIGGGEEKDIEKVKEVYVSIEAPVFVCSIEIAEMVKYVDNVFHALKVCFANEIGSVCKEFGIDSHEVMDIFCSDTKLNISNKYFRPGFAFGGSCLPKDLRALTHKTKMFDLNTPVLSSIIDSNNNQIKCALDMIVNKGKKNVGILGLSFKEGTDDLRESPTIILMESLLGKGYNLKAYDKNVNLAKVFGTNKEYLEDHIEHISKLMTNDIKELVDFAEIIVITNNSEEFTNIMSQLDDSHQIIDLVRINKDLKTEKNYEGISW
jgi:GDP-mannose 6-dehydrogenase